MQYIGFLIALNLKGKTSTFGNTDIQVWRLSSHCKAQETTFTGSTKSLVGAYFNWYFPRLKTVNLHFSEHFWTLNLQIKYFRTFQVRTKPCNIHRKTDYDTVGESLVILICFQVSHRKESTNVNKENVALHKISTHKGNRTNKLSRNTKYIYIYTQQQCQL